MHHPTADRRSRNGDRLTLAGRVAAIAGRRTDPGRTPRSRTCETALPGAAARAGVRVHTRRTDDRYSVLTGWRVGRIHVERTGGRLDLWAASPSTRTVAADGSQGTAGIRPRQTGQRAPVELEPGARRDWSATPTASAQDHQRRRRAENPTATPDGMWIVCTPAAPHTRDCALRRDSGEATGSRPGPMAGRPSRPAPNAWPRRRSSPPSTAGVPPADFEPSAVGRDRSRRTGRAGRPTAGASSPENDNARAPCRLSERRRIRRRGFS